jgi:hypothetical protein
MIGSRQELRDGSGYVQFANVGTCTEHQIRSTANADSLQDIGRRDASAQARPSGDTGRRTLRRSTRKLTNIG